jgi:Rrf2 family iron-sulfur cluster assembly transcriptional regulator
MQLSTRGRYAVMALADLAAREAKAAGRQPITLAQIATGQFLSLSYLEQLFGKLRRAGLVTSVRGPGGGYRLARPADAMPIADIVSAVDEPIRVTRCEEGGPGCMRAGTGVDGVACAPARCRTHDLWHELGRQIHLFLVGVTLGDVVAGRVAGRATAVPPAGARLARAAQAVDQGG